MPRNYTELPRHQVRRRDRAVSDDRWIRNFLRSAPWCALATVHEGQPFIHSNLFVFDEAADVLYLHTARVGRTAGTVGEGTTPVCFTTFRMGRLLPAETALDFSVEYESVSVFGRMTILEDADAARRALQLLLDKYAPHLRPGRDYRAITGDEVGRTAVYKIEVEHWIGKRNLKPADFPGAFTYDG